MAPKRRIKRVPERHYRMSVAGQLFKHLGLQMYSGAVPALAELVSNAYDAMARTVQITIPLGRAIEPTDEIIVVDDGFGMTFEEANEFYLSVGRDRRTAGDWTSPYNGLPPRKVQGRKGIGKLAGFGIADRIEVRTVKAGIVSNFALDFDGLTHSQKFSDDAGYEPETLPEDGSRVSEKPSTLVRLSRLKIQRVVNEEQFRQGLARRLLVLDQNFRVRVNKRPITRSEFPFQFRFPPTTRTWETTNLENGQQFKWWAGFARQTIPAEEQRGFVVYVRGKLAQTPWFFDLSGGAWGQHGLQYLTGEIQADFLDEAVDLIATDRGAVRWEDPIASPLKDWGRKKVADLLREWSDKRREAKIKSPKISQLLEKAERLPDNERNIFKRVVDRIVAIPQLDTDPEGRDIADELVEFVYNALTNREFLAAIRRINAASPEDRAHLTEVLSEWDILEAVSTAHLVKGRVEIIRKFEQLIAAKAPEKPDMQDYVRDHPWLIDPKWTMLVHEQQLDTMLANEFGLDRSSNAEGQRRLDFFCLGDRYQTAHVVEAKRPGALVGRQEFDQLRDYVLYLRKRLQDEATNPEDKRAVVRGLLIADRIRPGDDRHAGVAQDAGIFDIRAWPNLLATTQTLHQDFLKVVTDRAPPGDPRIEDLTDSTKSSRTPSRRTTRTRRLKRKAHRPAPKK